MNQDQAFGLITEAVTKRWRNSRAFRTPPSDRQLEALFTLGASLTADQLAVLGGVVINLQIEDLTSSMAAQREVLRAQLAVARLNPGSSGDPQ